MSTALRVVFRSRIRPPGRSNRMTRRADLRVPGSGPLRIRRPRWLRRSPTGLPQIVPSPTPILGSPTKGDIACSGRSQSRLAIWKGLCLSGALAWTANGRGCQR